MRIINLSEENKTGVTEPWFSILYSLFPNSFALQQFLHERKDFPLLVHFEILYINIA